MDYLNCQLIRGGDVSKGQLWERPFWQDAVKSCHFDIKFGCKIKVINNKDDTS